MRTGTEQKQNQTVGLDGGTRHMTTGAISAKSLVPEVGLEPTSLAAGDFESPASTNSATRATQKLSNY